MKKLVFQSLFLLAIQLFVLLFVFNLNDEFHKPPHSVHIWRQCDGASAALHYHTYKNNLLHPMSYNVELSNGEGGAEFPIAYWLAAKLSPADQFDASYLRYIHFGCCILFLAIANAVCLAVTESLVLGFFVAFLPFLSTIF